MVEVIPAILEKDFGEIEKKIKLVEKLVSWVQIDIADGLLVPNTTFLYTSAFKDLAREINLEAHLMVKEPVKFVDQFADAGFKRIYAHIEADKVEDFLAAAFKKNIEVGLAIDGPTPYEKIESYLDNIDGVLVMAIKAGFSGEPYREDTADKIKKIKEAFFDLPVCVDGAMNLSNAQKVVSAGATKINSNSYIFKSADIKKAIEDLQNLYPIST